MQKMQNTQNITTLILLSMIALFTPLILTSNVSADNDSFVDQVSITVPVSCTMSGNGMTSHNATIANGTYYSNIGETTITAFCNDISGFSIYAAGYTGNEIGATNSNKLVGTSASNNSTISTGTATGPVGGNDNSNWAMKLTAVSSPTPTYPIAISTGFNDYHAVPNEYTKVATRLSGSDVGQGAEGSTLTTTYAAYINKTQPADTYSGQVIYTLVHPASAPAPVVCNPSGTTISTIKCMQDISSTNKSSILSSMASEQQYTLKDKRDGKEYTIARLRDGNIWMTQNLDLDLDSSRTYTNLDTDIGYNSSTGQYDTATWTPMRSTYATGDTTWCEGGAMQSSSWCAYNYTPESHDPGNLYWSGTNYDSTPVSTGNAHYHLGNYYNWSAAVADNDTSEYTELMPGYVDANQSICPAGWMLPKQLTDYDDNPSNGSFYYLVGYYGWDGNVGFVHGILDEPLSIALSGYWVGSFTGVGEQASLHASEVFIWTTGYYDEYSTYIYGPTDEDASVWPSDGDSSGAGVSIRCLAR